MLLVACFVAVLSRNDGERKVLSNSVCVIKNMPALMQEDCQEPGLEQGFDAHQQANT